jgi:hypothetical protein
MTAIVSLWAWRHSSSGATFRPHCRKRYLSVRSASDIEANATRVCGNNWRNSCTITTRERSAGRGSDKAPLGDGVHSH